MIATSYNHLIGGAYNQTMATLPKGRVIVNTQYGTVDICRSAPSDTLDGIDTQALITEAREHGKFGSAPRVRRPKGEEIEPASTCPICHTYCCGDCQV